MCYLKKLSGSRDFYDFFFFFRFLFFFFHRKYMCSVFQSAEWINMDFVNVQSTPNISKYLKVRSYTEECNLNIFPVFVYLSTVLECNLNIFPVFVYLSTLFISYYLYVKVNFLGPENLLLDISSSVVWKELTLRVDCSQTVRTIM